MSFLGRMFKRNKGDDQIRPLAVHGAIASEAQRGISQQEMIEQLGINIHMIEDEMIQNLLKSLVHEWQHNDGKLIPVGPPDLNMLAMLIMASKLIRGSFLDDIDSEIGQLDAERLVTRIELDLDEEGYELGGTNLIDSLMQLVKTAYSDAKRGRKAKLLKISGRAMEVRVPEQKEIKGQGLLM